MGYINWELIDDLAIYQHVLKRFLPQYIGTVKQVYRKKFDTPSEYRLVTNSQRSALLKKQDHQAIKWHTKISCDSVQ